MQEETGSRPVGKNRLYYWQAGFKICKFDVIKPSKYRKIDYSIRQPGN